MFQSIISKLNDGCHYSVYIITDSDYIDHSIYYDPGAHIRGGYIQAIVTAYHIRNDNVILNLKKYINWCVESDYYQRKSQTILRVESALKSASEFHRIVRNEELPIDQWKSCVIRHIEQLYWRKLLKE